MSSATKNERAPRRRSDGDRPEKPMPRDAASAQSAAPMSPFTPIANYGFLSNCHTGALVAPDGTVDWLCVPRFDSPSVFGALVDRGAGSFRFAPFGINVPSARIYEPGTNTLINSWRTPRAGSPGCRSFAGGDHRLQKGACRRSRTAADGRDRRSITQTT